MSGIIAFDNTPEKTWMVANWAFRRFLEDVSACRPDDEEVLRELQSAVLWHGLILHNIAEEHPDLSDRLTAMIKSVALASISNPSSLPSAHSQPLTLETERAYQEGIRELLEIVEKADL